MLTAGFLQPLSTKGLVVPLPNDDDNNNCIHCCPHSLNYFFNLQHISNNKEYINKYEKKLSKEKFKYNRVMQFQKNSLYILIFL